MTSVCTSTAPSNCNSSEIIFYFGSYHAMSQICTSDGSGGWTDCSAPGQVEITAPNGDITTGPFTDVFFASANNYGGTCPAADITNNAPTSVLPSDASITCYAANSAGGTTYAVTGDTLLARWHAPSRK